MKVETKKQKFLKLLESNWGNISATSRITKISRASHYKWCKEDEKYKNKFNEISEGILDNVETALQKNALEGNVAAQIFIMKTKGRSRGYAERVESFNVNVDFDYRKIANIESVEEAEKEILRLERIIGTKES